jgi:hypothetical protein
LRSSRKEVITRATLTIPISDAALARLRQRAAEQGTSPEAVAAAELDRPTVYPPPQTQEEASQRIRDAKTLPELWAAAASAATFEPDDGYDLIEEMEKSRRQTGQMPLNDPPAVPAGAAVTPPHGRVDRRNQ